MTNTGLSEEGLARLKRVLSAHVTSGDIPGIVALVSRDDDVHIETLGSLSLGADAPPMRRDTIFRISSMTKPVVAVGAMMLVEDCVLRLDDPVDQWLPELASRRVLKSIESKVDDTVPARRAITVRDVLTYRMGFGSIMAAPDTYPIQRAIRELRIGGDGPPRPSDMPKAHEWMRRLGSLPLLAQPGERWMYHVSGDVLGVLVARASGLSLGDFLRERIFEPLGMLDTGFSVPAEEIDRLATQYVRDQRTGSLVVWDEARGGMWSTGPRFETGAGGLVSTIDDYHAFCRMMLGRGTLDGVRLLSPATVSLMTADQLTPEQRAGSDIFFGGHSSWASGMAVNIGREQIWQTPGRFGWDGGYGSTAYTDPAQRTIGILLTQRMMDSPEPPRVASDFWTAAYGAIA
jgi:CubicO group peptidase (beta-lactamase class C family)